MLKYCILLIIIFSQLAIASQKDTITTDEIIVTASKTPILFSESGRIINTLNKKEFENYPYLNLNDVLKNSFNVDIRQRGNIGVQADISIRGSNADQVMVLLNGLSINDPQTGHHNLILPIDFSNIYKIELLEGSGSRIYGPNAFAGAVNIITSSPDSNAKSYSLGFGNNNYWLFSLNTSFQYKNFNSYFSISKSKSDGFTKNTDFDNFNMYFNSNFKTKFGVLSLQSGVTNRQFGANSFYTPEYPDQFEKIKNFFISAKYDNEKENRTVLEFYARENKEEFRLFRDTFPEWYKSHNYHKTNVIGFNHKYSLISLLGISNMGFSFKSDEIMSNVMGKDMMPEKIEGEFYKYYTKSAFRLISSIFFEHNAYWGPISISGGVSITGLRNYDWMIDPGIDINYKLIDNLSIFSSLNIAHRLPTFTDMFYSDPTSLGNRDLKPEEAISYEVGSKYLNDFMKLQLAVFKRNGKNLIDWVKAEGDSLWRSTNLAEVNSSGAEIFLTIFINRMINKNLIFDKINLSYCYNSLDNNTGFILSEYVLNYLNHKFNANLDLKIPYNFLINMNFSYNSRIGKYLEYSSKTIKEFEPYFITDLQLQYALKEHSIYIQIRNLLDKEYMDISNVKVPGRWFGFGIRGNFR